jgi:hypothetical protein
MERTYEQIIVSVSLSRQNNEQDDIDDEAFENLHEEIRRLCKRDEYQHISPTVVQ